MDFSFTPFMGSWGQDAYLLFFRRCWARPRTELADILFGLDAILFDCKLLLVWCWMEFSLLPCKLLPTATRDAPSKRSFRLSPTIRKLGKRIQHVFTVHEPDIPWHLHSWRISLCTCYREREKERERDGKHFNFVFVKWFWCSAP